MQILKISLINDDDYKRPKSPIDRIKSLFRGKSSVKDSTIGLTTGNLPIGGGYTSSPVYTSHLPLLPLTVPLRYSLGLTGIDKLSNYHHSAVNSVNNSNISSSSKRYTTCIFF